MELHDCPRCGYTKTLDEFYNRAKDRRCKTCCSEISKARYHASATTRTGVKLRNRKRLLDSYGLTWDEYAGMHESQDGKCAICGVEMLMFAEAKASAASCVDHCHSTGKVRGLLCRSCNLGIGYFKDQPNILAQAIKYLEVHSVQDQTPLDDGEAAPRC